MSGAQRWYLQNQDPDGTWVTLMSVDDPERALPCLCPGDRLIMDAPLVCEPQPCPRYIVGILIIFAFVVGFALAMAVSA